MVTTYGTDMASSDMSVLGTLLLVYGIIFAFAGIIGIVCYIFQSLGLYKMAKALEFSSPWMAWVPLLNTYTLGKIGSKYVKNDGRPSAKFGGWLLGLEIAMVVVVIGMIGSIISMIPAAIAMEELGMEGPSTAFMGGFASFILTYLAMIGIAIAFSIVNYIALWRVYSIFDNSNATVFLVLSIIFGITMPFFLFAMRNNEPKLTFEERNGFVLQPISEIPEASVVEESVAEETVATEETVVTQASDE